MQLSVLVLVGCQGKKSAKQSPPKADVKKEETSVPPPASPLDLTDKPAPKSNPTPDSSSNTGVNSNSDNQNRPNNKTAEVTEPEQSHPVIPPAITPEKKSIPESTVPVSPVNNSTTKKDSKVSTQDNSDQELVPNAEDIKLEISLTKECLRAQSKLLYDTVAKTVGFKTSQQVYALMDSAVLLCEKQLKEETPIPASRLTKYLEDSMVEVIAEYADLKVMANQWIANRKNQKVEFSDVEALYTSLQYRNTKPQIKGKFVKQNAEIIEYTLDSVSGTEELSVKTAVGSRSAKSFLYNSNPDQKTKISISLKVNTKGNYDFIIEGNSKKNIYQVVFPNGKEQDLVKSYSTLVFTKESWQRLVADNAARILSEDLKREITADSILVNYSDKSQSYVRGCNFNKSNIACTDPEIEISVSLKQP